MPYGGETLIHKILNLSYILIGDASDRAFLMTL
jgi:hypothetical protein